MALIQTCQIQAIMRLSFSAFHWDNSFSGSSKFFHLKICLGLALGESWLALAQPEKNTDVSKGLLPWEGLLRHTCKNHLRREKGCKLMEQI